MHSTLPLSSQSLSFSTEKAVSKDKNLVQSRSSFFPDKERERERALMPLSLHPQLFVFLASFRVFPCRVTQVWSKEEGFFYSPKFCLQFSFLSALLPFRCCCPCSSSSPSSLLLLLSFPSFHLPLVVSPQKVFPSNFDSKDHKKKWISSLSRFSKWKRVIGSREWKFKTEKEREMRENVFPLGLFVWCMVGSSCLRVRDKLKAMVIFNVFPSSFSSLWSTRDTCFLSLHDSLDSLWSHPTELEPEAENLPLPLLLLPSLSFSYWFRPSFCRSWYSFSFTAGQRVTHRVDFQRKFLLDCCFEGHETHSQERMSWSCQLLPLCSVAFFLSTASPSFSSSCRFIHLLMSAPPQSVSVSVYAMIREYERQYLCLTVDDNNDDDHHDFSRGNCQVILFTVDIIQRKRSRRGRQRKEWGVKFKRQQMRKNKNNKTKGRHRRESWLQMKRKKTLDCGIEDENQDVKNAGVEQRRRRRWRRRWRSEITFESRGRRNELWLCLSQKEVWKRDYISTSLVPELFFLIITCFTFGVNSISLP